MWGVSSEAQSRQRRIEYTEEIKMLWTTQEFVTAEVAYRRERASAGGARTRHQLPVRSRPAARPARRFLTRRVLAGH
jgi:hypothetical protein